MTLAKMVAIHGARPFRPFDIYIADGRVIRISHPEILVIGGRTVTVHQEADTEEVLDLLLVASLKSVAISRPPRNGN